MDFRKGRPSPQPNKTPATHSIPISNSELKMNITWILMENNLCLRKLKETKWRRYLKWVRRKNGTSSETKISILTITTSQTKNKSTKHSPVVVLDRGIIEVSWICLNWNRKVRLPGAQIYFLDIKNLKLRD